MIKAVGFDFDGTLIMSEDKKGPAMVAVFKEKFGVSKGVRKAYEDLIGKGYSRDAKVVLLFKRFFDRKPSTKELKMVADHFGEHYVRSMNTCPLFQCANVIKELKKQVKFTFMLSLENSREVRKVARHCGVARYFDEILGGPTSKIENFKHVIAKHGVKPSDVLYIGDAHSDVVASKKMGVKIILLGKKHTFEKLKGDLEADFVFSNLCDVPRKLEKL